MTDFVTEAFNSSIRDCHATIYHFVKHNSWFIGKIHLLTTSDNYPTEEAIRSIKQIYTNVEIVNVSSNSNFISSLGSAKITKSNIWRYSILIDTYRLLYLSNLSTVTSSLATIVNENTTFISKDASVFYLNGKRPGLTLELSNQEIISLISSKNTTVSVNDEIIYSSDILDKLFSRSGERLRNAKVIVFDTLVSNLSNSTRINTIRINSIRETSSYLASPAAKHIVKRAIYTPIPKSGEANNVTKNADEIVKRRTRHILIDDIPDNSLSFDLNNSAYLKNKNKKIKLAIVTGIWQRPEIVQYFAAGVKELEKLEEFDITTIISGSEGETSRKLVEDHGFTYIEIPNQPLATKMNAPLKIAKELGVDYVLCMGSDDILHPNALLEYLKYMRSEIDFIGVTDFYFYDTTSCKSAYWGGYREQYRSGHTCGAGRALSAKILEKWDWTIWDISNNTMLDSSMQSNLETTDHTSIYFSLKTKGLYGLDIKSSVNMTPFTLWDNTEFIDTDEIKNNFSYLALI